MFLTRLISLLILSTFLVSCGSRYKKKLTILFDRVDHLRIGSEVYMKGVLIGEVKRFDLAPGGVWVDIKITDDIMIPVDSRFEINSNVLGTADIRIEPSDKTTYLASKDTVPGFFKKKGILDDFLADSVNRDKIYRFLDTLNERLKRVNHAKAGNEFEITR